MGCNVIRRQTGDEMAGYGRIQVFFAAVCGAFVLATAAAGGAAASPAGLRAAGGPPTVKKVAAIAATVPQSIRAKGTLTVASDATYPPNEFVAANGKSLIGWDVDLGHAIASVLGLDFHFVNATFDTIIPGLQSGKYDVGMSSFYDTKAREKVVDFVTYYLDGSSFLEPANGRAVTKLAQLCGLTVAVETGTTEQDDVTAQDKTCKAGGKPGVTVRAFPTQNDANLALISGRAQVGDVDTVVGAYQVKLSNGKLKLSGSYGAALYGIALPKHDGMTKPIQAALQHLIATGAYRRILVGWNAERGAIGHAQIDVAAKSP
jgi:polar amino acid transport system substrate-binding protein